MKGIILCGGLGTRLSPLTKVTNKHLLPLYDKPMVFYPIQTLVDSGIREIMLVTGGNSPGEFLRVVGNGEEFGLRHIAYTYQQRPAGIADALGLAEEWAKGEPVCVVLGDNILEKPFPEAIKDFEANPDGARAFLTRNDNPQWYGVAEFDKKGDLVAITEKPKKPKTNLIVVGVYIYDSTVWDYLKELKPSQRNELEITDLNNSYLKRGKLKAHTIEGWWGDAGESIDVYMKCCIKMMQIKQNCVG